VTRLPPKHAASLSAIVIALFAIALFPSEALAWTPGTHVYLGDAVLRSLAMLPGNIAGLLGAFPYDFLYGSIAADTSIAKKYAAVGRHSHSWGVGFDILDRARDDALKAFSYGYLAHLAADVVAHNAFVPYQLAITRSTTGFGHSYWETRFETHLGEWAPRRARELILLDHSRSDGHLDRILSPTIFSTSTNRRIFRGMVVAADMESWQRVFALMLERSRWDLAHDLVGGHLTMAFDYVMDLLIRLDRSGPMQFDPSGHDRLQMAKRIRRSALRVGGEAAVAEQALRHFVLPAATEPLSLRLERPLFPPLPEQIALSPRSLSS
jgi:Zinc dependent phospholipase C